MPQVRVPVPFRQYTGGQARVSVQGLTVGAALDDLVAHYPELRPHLYDNQGNLIKTTHESVNVVLEKQDIRELEGTQTPLTESDQLMILRTWPAAISASNQFNQ